MRNQPSARNAASVRAGWCSPAVGSARALLFGACVVAALTSGCASMQIAPVTTVPPTVMMAVIAALARRDKKDLQFSPGTHADENGKRLDDKSDDEQANDRHRGFFIWR